MVITRRLCSFGLALVIAASSLFPAAAWSKDSFISGGEEYESTSDAALSDDLPVPDVYASPRRAPGMFKVSAAHQAAVDANTIGKLVVPATLPSSVDGTFQVMSKYYNYQPATQYTPKFEADYWRDVVTTITPSPFWGGTPGSGTDDALYLFYDGLIHYSPDVSDPHEMVRGLAIFCDKDKAVFPKGNFITGAIADFGSDSWSFTVNYDVSSYSSSAFSLDGVFGFASGFIGPSTDDSWAYTYFTSVDVLVDGQQVLSLSRGAATFADFGGYVYSGSSVVSVISFRFTLPFWSFVSSDPALAGLYNACLACSVSPGASNALTISFLDGQDVINAQNDKTKSDINKHEEYESQWTGSMTQNFNALGFADFSWSDSLVSGFSLFSGIFMDIWRALGGATILFTFPLLLGIALLLVGRISRSGGRSGSGKGGGDGG